jgi:hypothetical protein
VFVSSDNPPDLTIAGISPVAGCRASTEPCKNARLPMQCAVWGSACGGVSGVVHDVPLHGFVIGG